MGDNKKLTDEEALRIENACLKIELTQASLQSLQTAREQIVKKVFEAHEVNVAEFSIDLETKSFVAKAEKTK